MFLNKNVKKNKNELTNKDDGSFPHAGFLQFPQHVL